MWNNNDPQRTVILPPRKGFSTPSPASNNPRSSFSPMSETKRSSPASKRDLFHVIHKVPAGDSPYVRAKHIQLIEKDPSRAISMFWSAINAGDRVESALKDMAIVMKQLDRSDEAIEAVKSFRHLCPVDSQESLDNVLVELYKRAGRIEEEIEMLQHKLKLIEEGSAFGGRRTKTARSQGKKVHITLEEEKSRILGNLAWACLQQNSFKAAEDYYRRALVLEPDKNKQCNLAICLMSMNRLSEARSLLRAVKLSCGSNPMDESFARSYERACEMLIELDPKLALEPPPKNGDRCRNIPTPARREETREFYCGNNFENMSKSHDSISALNGMNFKYVQQQPVTVDQLKRGYFEETPNERRSGFVKRRAEPETATSWRRNTEPQSNTWCRRQVRTPFTQPRRCLWDDDWRKKDSWEEDSNLSQKSLTEEKCLSVSDIETPSNTTIDYSVSTKKKSWADMAEEEDDEDFDFEFYQSPFLQTQMKKQDQRFEEEEFNDENVDFNVVARGSDNDRLQTQMKDMAQNMGSDAFSKSQSVRRSLFSEQDKGNNITLLRRNNRLKVFQDITQSP